MPAIATLDQAIRNLRINWQGGDWGEYRDYSDERSISYSFPTSFNDGPFYFEGDGLVQMTALQKSYTRLAFELWDDIIASERADVTLPVRLGALAEGSGAGPNGTGAAG